MNPECMKKEETVQGNEIIEGKGSKIRACGKYLGALLYENDYTDDEIRQRGGKVERMFRSIPKGFLNKREVTKKTKMALYKTTFLPTILLCSSKSWTVPSINSRWK